MGHGPSQSLSMYNPNVRRMFAGCVKLGDLAFLIILNVYICNWVYEPLACALNTLTCWWFFLGIHLFHFFWEVLTSRRCIGDTVLFFIDCMHIRGAIRWWVCRTHYCGSLGCPAHSWEFSVRSINVELGCTKPVAIKQTYFQLQSSIRNRSFVKTLAGRFFFKCQYVFSRDLFRITF